ncbi:embryonic testis differentiation protein homolog B [Talpa occidentalis]|uniref:embryonic testis differentiation protein homolog B n=1 Tax=Talpa occidentalis TaxID=50954 RepID=UPI00188E751C|nr:embryonic testis differentiation protein homolog B [Talpa occidentalis]XP_054551518.1 embryonic testis differentiation protein homolog B [Talpa occidentalis]
MDKANSEVGPNTPTPSITKTADKHVKRAQASQNVLNFLISRQLGRQRSDFDLSKWLWMMT